jgi:hypothetical protein
VEYFWKICWERSRFITLTRIEGAVIADHTWCETMEKESNEQRGMGIHYKGSQGQTEKTVEL